MNCTTDIATSSYQQMSLLLSSILGYVLSAGACFYKVPVIRNILKAGNVESLSALSLYLEISGHFANIVYNMHRNNPISTYGDVMITALQNVVIIFLVWRLGGGKGVGSKGTPMTLSHIVPVLLLGACFVATLLLLPNEYQASIISYSIIISIGSKVPQIIANFRDKRTGVQSLWTAMNSCVGPVFKLYIAVVQTKDFMLVASAVMALVLNATILAQIVAFGGHNKKKDQ